ncbi:MAG TPA: maltose alpha-D-glucosyltransferase [Actinomycetota bacterium]|nr:maltose alpha-D-glucosyltransferase [Actinomycetota bacterium]
MAKARTRVAAEEPAPTLAPVAAGAASTGWYQDAVIYELHVRAYQDSNADGVGDLAGLVRRLDHIRDLGATAVWLLPFYPSPLRDDGYDIAAYKAIHPAYGTMRDFRTFLREAHRRDLRVITEVVMNHTSDEHPWFQRARAAKAGSWQRNFYVWADTPEGYPDARVIFGDFESSNWAWDAVAGQYFWHRFYSHQPDLNYDEPRVRRAMFDVVDFWLGLGVDGLRLDAIPYLFEREGTNCENLPETLGLLTELREHVDATFRDRMLLAEANQWPEDAVAYFGDGDRCHMAFHFPLMPRMFMANRMEDRFPLIDILNQTPPIPDTAQWATFLRNHDELTLEMVTDEERDYMYRVYAEDPQARVNLGIRRRLAPLLGNDRRRIELMNALLFSLPGTPVIYYGDEIGMGDNIYLGDRNGVRTPMQWNQDRNAGFSAANPQRLYLPLVADPENHPAAVNVEAQQNNPTSLLWWMRRVIGAARRSPSLSRGDIEFLYPENRKVVAFLRTFGEDRTLVVANLSRSAQFVELDLSRFDGQVPVELFGPTHFPRIGQLPYFVTLGPYGYFWFRLQPDEREEELAASPVPTLETTGTWDDALDEPTKGALERALPRFLVRQRWFGAKGRRIAAATIADTIRIQDADPDGLRGLFALVDVTFTEGEPATYAFPLVGRRDGDDVGPEFVVARIETPDGPWQLVDGVRDAGLAGALLEMVERRRVARGRRRRLAGTRAEGFAKLRGEDPVDPQFPWGDQTNTSVTFGDRLVLKLFRRLEDGINPELEVGRFLTDRTSFIHAAPMAGAIELTDGDAASTVAFLQGYVQNEGDAWQYALDAVRESFERALAVPADQSLPLVERPVMDMVGELPSLLTYDLIGPFLGSAWLLGRRTAQLHLALGSRPDDPVFAPEPVTRMYQRSLYQSMRSQAVATVRRLGRHEAGPEVEELLARQDELLSRFAVVTGDRISGQRIRLHGDFHLGQVLWTGRDFIVIDFEGEPARPLSERRIKRSPLRDVAGMLRSFDYASRTAMRSPWVEDLSPDSRASLAEWARAWTAWVSATFLGHYFEVAGDSPMLPESEDETRRMLHAMLLDKAVYEVGYELDHRPEWLAIPVRGVLDLLDEGP